jgi:hypothetical protein
METLCAFCQVAPATVKVPYDQIDREVLVFACPKCARKNRLERLEQISVTEFIERARVEAVVRDLFYQVALPVPVRPMTPAELAREGRLLPDIEPSFTLFHCRTRTVSGRR